jgi:hypothetical protein
LDEAACAAGLRVGKASPINREPGEPIGVDDQPAIMREGEFLRPDLAAAGVAPTQAASAGLDDGDVARLLQVVQAEGELRRAAGDGLPSSGTVTAVGVSFKFGIRKYRPTGTISGRPRAGQDLRALARSAGSAVALTGATIAEHHRIVDAGSAGDATVVHWRVASFQHSKDRPNLQLIRDTEQVAAVVTVDVVVCAAAGLARTTRSGRADAVQLGQRRVLSACPDFLRWRAKIIPSSDVNVIEG